MSAQFGLFFIPILLVIGVPYFLIAIIKDGSPALRIGLLLLVITILIFGARAL